MNSSYNQSINFGDLLSNISFIKSPQVIVEIGILEGFSLDKFVKNTPSSTKINAYDIFTRFNGNHANELNIRKKFMDYSNVTINDGDFYEVYKLYEDSSIDLIHIDIANNGDVYKFVFDNYMKKLSDNGILLLEGGSKERDNIEWMNKYNKPKISPIIEEYKKKSFEIQTIGVLPSITICKKFDSKLH